MKEWSTACPDWERRIVKGESLVPFSPLFPDAAEAALNIFKALKIVDAAESPTMEAVARQWVFDFVAVIFGAYDSETGRRLVNDFFLLISKKNGKSTTAAGIMLTALLLNWRKSAEYIILAPTIEVANNSAEPAMDMVNEDPELRALLKPIAHERTIEHLATGATLKIVAADSQVVGGKKATGVLIDELWLFGKKAGAENMFREATGGLASRPEGFVVALSTQSDEPPAGVFKDTLQRFRDIRDGKIVAPRSLGVLYEFPEAYLKSGDFKKPENFYVTNPNLGLSVDEQFLLDEFEKARPKGAKSLNGFFAKHLNIEIGMNLRSDRWTGADFWLASADPTLVSLEALLQRSECVTMGIDGGGLDDLLGLAVVGREVGTRRWLLWTHSWAHKNVLELRKEIAPQLLEFERQGDLTICEDAGDPIVGVGDYAEQVFLSGCLPEKEGIGVDPLGIGKILDEIAAREIPGELVVGIPQGFRLQGAIKTTELCLAIAAQGGKLESSLVHAPQDIMNWCAGNARIEPRANGIMITKQASGFSKIDPLMAAFDGVALMSRNPESKRSAYEDKPLLIL